MEGKKFDNDKVRMDLLPHKAIKEIAEVFTFGAKKYGDRNWEKGIKWSRLYAALQRHIKDYWESKDFDEESGKKHLAHAGCCLTMLLEYYTLYPEGDDRPHSYLSYKRIGLDIDDVLADWITPFCNKVNILIPTSWNFNFNKHINKLIDEDFNYQEFMENLPVKTKPEDIPFEPVCYITSRIHVDSEIAENWLNKNGFSQSPVIQTQDKVTVAKEMNLDIFVDDKFQTFVDMNNAGICCYLFDAPHNQKYQVGHKRIYDLKSLI